MKPHVVVKLRAPAAGGARLPDWLTFVTDKSVVRGSLEPPVDRVMADAGLRFWATREFPAAGPTWNDAEVAHGLDRTFRLILPDGREPGAEVVHRLRHLPGVEAAHSLEVATVPLPDPRGGSPAAARRRPGEAIFLPYARAVTAGLPAIRIAVVDTGADLGHPELAGRFAGRADFVELRGLDTRTFVGDITGYDDRPDDEVGHGTHVSGIIGARGLAMDEGVAPGCGLMAVRVLATVREGDRRVGAGIVDNINAGIKWAVDNGAAVINMSLGIRHTEGGLPHRDVIAYALARGVTVVAASGNDGTAALYYPGALPGVIAVGAVDGGGAVAPFTSYGAGITVVAPGVGIHSAYVPHAYAVASGTSQAAPFVTGGVALLQSLAHERGRSLSPTEVAGILRDTSDRLTPRPRDKHSGYGLLNLADAFRLLTHSLN
ncbi:S8 family serine peptidase [Couchioplanes azureus]|uniref:S8 family serine peptidase n=1 Tax=Couchioplanes caeruleus TaxID=56438 RepID=UPI0016712B60|nr:S8 family serine peptidase [Couchioplanes caeruleus]GGQ70041.1 hypothetical protein GCM10010166_44840 [Couchioplanes caeruleus subsp. azureus]